MPICPKKGQKGAKVGGAVGKNQLFCVLLKIVITFSDILHEIFLEIFRDVQSYANLERDIFGYLKKYFFYRILR